MVEIVVPLALFGAICLSIGLVLFFRYRTRRELQLTLREAIGAGQTLSADVLRDLTAALQPHNQDLRRGIVSMALGLAVVVFALALDEPSARGPLLAISAFPFFVGAAYLVLWRLHHGPGPDRG